MTLLTSLQGRNSSDRTSTGKEKKQYIRTLYFGRSKRNWNINRWSKIIVIKSVINSMDWIEAWHYLVEMPDESVCTTATWKRTYTVSWKSKIWLSGSYRRRNRNPNIGLTSLYIKIKQPMKDSTEISSFSILASEPN